jgi:hypothetical protein
MKFTMFSTICLTAMFMCMLSLGASALTVADLGDNITIWDSDGYLGSGVGGEDNETEPGMTNNQNWDMEGFFLTDSTVLTMVGGFDFVNGVPGYASYTSGDVFIALGDNPHPAPADYDYVLDVDWVAGEFDLRPLIGDASDVSDVLVAGNNPDSNPWQYTGSTALSLLHGSVGLLGSTYTNSEVGFLAGNDTHFAASFDLAVFEGQGFTVHFTMGCGNDNLMGLTEGTSGPPRDPVVPEPASITLFSIGISALMWKRRKNLL